MADEDGVVVAGGVEQPEQVAGEVLDAVGLDVRRRARAAVAPLVGREHVVPGRGERLDLVAPRVGALSGNPWHSTTAMGGEVQGERRLMSAAVARRGGG